MPKRYALSRLKDGWQFGEFFYAGHGQGILNTSTQKGIEVDSAHTLILNTDNVEEIRSRLIQESALLEQALKELEIAFFQI